MREIIVLGLSEFQSGDNEKLPHGAPSIPRLVAFALAKAIGSQCSGLKPIDDQRRRDFANLDRAISPESARRHGFIVNSLDTVGQFIEVSE